jgi:hypothetical protein
MNVEARHAHLLEIGVEHQPTDAHHRCSKAIEACEVVYISVYTCVYNTVYRNRIKPAPHAKQFSDDGVGTQAGMAGDPPHLRVVV